MAKQKYEPSEAEAKLLKRVIKKPRTANELAALCGYDSARAISRMLGKLKRANLIVATEKGYVKA